MPQPYGRRNVSRSNGGRGYAGRNDGPKGPDQRVLIGLVAGGGAVVLILLILVLMKGGKSSTVAPPSGLQPLREGGPSAVRAPPPPTPKIPPKPLTQPEKDRIHACVTRLSAKEPEAKRLVKEGFEAQNAGDNDRAQECWKEAYEILTTMIEESNDVFEDIGEERVEMYAAQDYNATGEWPTLKAQFMKYVETE